MLSGLGGRSVKTMKKHSRQEILLKLGEAAELERAGRSQVEVCKVLGVSVMTFHRWRKLPMVAKAEAGRACDRTRATVRGGSR